MPISNFAKKLAITTSLIFLISGCAKPITMSPQASKEEIKREKEIQRTMALKEYVKMSERLFNVSYPILSKNQSLCGKDIKYDLGLEVWGTDRLGGGWKRVARKIYGIDNYISVMHVHKQSPAYRAGLRKGDKIKAINNKTVGKGEDELKRVAELLDNVNKDKVTFIIERKEETLTKTVRPTKICNYEVLLNYHANELNAYANGKQIVLYKGMMKFANNDNDLALIVGHEMAHNSMGHIDKKLTNRTIGHIGGLLVDALLGSAGVHTGGEFGNFGAALGANSYSVDFEKEADYVGMYYMARAGFDTSNVANLWRRMAIENPKAINKGYTHPTNPDRYLAIEKTYKEISAKKSNGKKLEPKIIASK